MNTPMTVVGSSLILITLTSCTAPPPPAATTNPPTEAPATTAPPGPAIALDGSVVTINPASLESPFYSFVETNPADPYYNIHTNQPDLFLGIELYTMYGAGWTGELGTFALDCTANGICVYLDIDGTGPEPALGPASVGQITINQLEGGYDVTLTGVAFGEYTLAELTLAS